MPTTHHVGFAGEAAVASEFSIRGYIVSLPMVDLGTDLFVENHNNGQVWRVQVKTALPKANNPNHFQFGVKELSIHAPTAKATHFAFVMRLADAWKLFIIAQPVLSNFVLNNNMGSLSANNPNRTFTFIHNPAAASITCSGTNMLPFSTPAAWNTWPVI